MDKQGHECILNFAGQSARKHVYVKPFFSKLPFSTITEKQRLTNHNKMLYCPKRTYQKSKTEKLTKITFSSLFFIRIEKKILEFEWFFYSNYNINYENHFLNIHVYTF